MSETEMTWALGSGEGRIGTGNWRSFPKERLPELFSVASGWKRELAGIEKPWLCWCVDEEWCLTQQQLVRATGWTPVVGTDGHARRPTLIRGASFLDFNGALRLPLMWIHFPLEFVFLFANRLAFWHSDVLPPLDVMRTLAECFENLPNGSTMAVRGESVGWGQRIRRLIKRKPMFYKRWFEVVGCTTAMASQDQFENGCGWWRYPRFHPNAKPWTESAYQREHGVGIWLWMTHCRGDVRDVGCDIHPYHYSTNKDGYVRRRTNAGELASSKRHELNETFDLSLLRRELGVEFAQIDRLHSGESERLLPRHVTSQPQAGSEPAGLE